MENGKLTQILASTSLRDVSLRGGAKAPTRQSKKNIQPFN